MPFSASLTEESSMDWNEAGWKKRKTEVELTKSDKTEESKDYF